MQVQCKACMKVFYWPKEGLLTKQGFVKFYNENEVIVQGDVLRGVNTSDPLAPMMSEVFLKNTIRPGSLKRQLEFVDLRELKARLANDDQLLQSTIADGRAYADQDTGDDMYPVLKQEDTPSYI